MLWSNIGWPKRISVSEEIFSEDFLVLSFSHESLCFLQCRHATSFSSKHIFNLTSTTDKESANACMGI